MRDERENTERLTQYLTEVYSEEITVPMIAEHMHMSVSMLYRLSQKVYKHSIMEELTRIRMEKAMELLRETSRSITEVAFECGYHDAAAFSRKFREYFGKQPSVARCRMKESKICLSVDAKRGTAFHNPWNVLINVGSFEALLQKSVKSQLLKLREELHFRYLRVWNIFPDWILVSERNSQIGIRYAYIDEIFDYFVDNHIIPFIDLGLKFIQNIKDKDDLDYNLRQTMEITLNYKQWGRLITDLVNHFIMRYGQEEVSGWIFEIYQNPRSYEENIDSFFGFYEEMVTFLKGRLPEALVGGCGWPNANRFEMFIERISRMHIKPDFVSVYYYGIVFDGIEVNQGIRNLRDRLDILRDLLKRAKLGDMKIILSEWNTSIKSQSEYNDSTQKAVDLLKIMSHNFDTLYMGGYNNFGDILKENDTCGLFGGGLGLVTKDNIKKPVYFAYKFMCDLANEMISCGENYVVTKQERTYKIVLWEDGKLDTDSSDHKKSQQMEITIDNIPNGDYLERQYHSNDSMQGYQSSRAIIGNHPDLNDQNIYQYIAYPNLAISVRRCTENSLTIKAVLKKNFYVFCELIPIERQANISSDMCRE